MFSWLHFRYIFPLSRTLKCFARWEFTGKPDPGVDEITNGLKRLVTGVLTHPMTIGKVISAHTPKRKKDKPKSIHLIGTDTPEVRLVAFFMFQSPQSIQSQYILAAFPFVLNTVIRTFIKSG